MASQPMETPVPSTTTLGKRKSLTAPGIAFDDALTSLFASSSGPITAPRQTSHSHNQTSNSVPKASESLLEDTHVPQVNSPTSELSPTLDSLPDTDFTPSSESGTKGDNLEFPSRKRQRIAPADDIEGAYMRRLANQVAQIQPNKKVEEGPGGLIQENGGQNLSENAVGATGPVAGDQIPQHEALGGSGVSDALDKGDRTVFLGNVSIKAIKSKSARKTLLSHLSSCLTTLRSEGGPHKVESLRFRSTAFASSVGPKRAAYAKKELMEETTHSTNAYVVYTSQVAARKAAKWLNGTVVLDRHIRTDLVSKPSEIDHRRCVFVGNLGFVNEEIMEVETETGAKERKRKAKEPADAEEGLWRTFSKAGKVESVRVVRDRSTRVGKGIAYVQFHDQNSVEAALLYNEKKFAPLLPRKLRVSRARKPRASKPTEGVPGREVAPGPGNPGVASSKGWKTHTDTRKHSQKTAPIPIFEGHRATRSNKPGGHGLKRRKQAAKPTSRSSRRGAAFKAAGGNSRRNQP